MSRRPVLAAAALLLASGMARSMWVLPPEAPLERLLANTAKRLEAHPRDPHVHYLMARLHAMGYACPGGDKGVIRATANEGDGGVDWFFAGDSVRVRLEKEIDDARLRHLAAAVRHYRLAAEFADPAVEEQKGEAALARFGRAWILEDAGRFALRAGDPEGAEPESALGEKEIAEIDARIERLASTVSEERASAFDALRRGLDAAYPRLLARRTHADPAVRSAIGRLLERRWLDLALADYRAAWALSSEAALKASWRDVMATDHVAIESGEGIERLLAGRTPSKEEKEEIANIQKARAEIEKKPRGPVTPILFPVDGPASLASLLPAGRSAEFDLDGDLVPERWPWPSADAGLLVWAPDAAKPITSGRQLLGGRTWWVFWRDGFEPLSSLDDDGNGRLEGRELDGIGVWRDLDGDGRAEAGEVESAAARGISWIATRATRLEDGVPANDRGIGFRDGTTRPTYDWSPTPVARPASRP
jgi:hypothetical protein